MLSPDPETTAFFVIAIIILCLSLIMVLGSSYLMVIHKKRWFVAFPLFLWSLHLSIFYCCVLHAYQLGTSLNLLYGVEDLVEIWSAIQRLHGMVTVFYMTYILHLEMSK